MACTAAAAAAVAPAAAAAAAVVASAVLGVAGGRLPTVTAHGARRGAGRERPLYPYGGRRSLASLQLRFGQRMMPPKSRGNAITDPAVTSAADLQLSPPP